MRCLKSLFLSVLITIVFNYVAFAGIGVLKDEVNNQQVSDVAVLDNVLQAFVDAKNSNYMPEKVTKAFDLLRDAISTGKITLQNPINPRDALTDLFDQILDFITSAFSTFSTSGDLVITIFSDLFTEIASALFTGLDLGSIITLLNPNNGNSIDKTHATPLQSLWANIRSRLRDKVPHSTEIKTTENILKSFVDAENSNYAPEKVKRAFALLKESADNGKIPYQVIDLVTTILLDVFSGAFSTLFSSLDVSGLINSIISDLRISLCERTSQNPETCKDLNK